MSVPTARQRVDRPLDRYVWRQKGKTRILQGPVSPHSLVDLARRAGRLQMDTVTNVVGYQVVRRATGEVLAQEGAPEPAKRKRWKR
jgi:hypothetical protein